MKLIAPLTEKSFYEEKDADLIKKKLKNINDEFGKIIKECSKFSHLPEHLITAFIFIESGGNIHAVNDKSYGLMQISPVTVTEVLYFEQIYKRLTPEEENYIKKIVGEKIWEDIKAKSKLRLTSSYLTKELLLKPEVNIFFGTMFLSQLIDRFNTNGIVDIHKVVTAYNAGLYSKSLQKIKNYSINEIDKALSVLNPITSSYILKLVGKNGVITLLT